MATRSSTPAAKRRAASRKSGREAPRRGHAAPAKSKRKPAPRKPASKRAPAKRTTSKRAAPKRPQGTLRRPPKRASTAGRRPKPARRLLRASLPSARTSLIVLAVVLAALAAGYFLWLRNSSLVAITEVKVSGLSSPDAPQIEQALTKAATGMTTLNVDERALDRAVADYPTVLSVSADPALFHGLAISVSERPPVLMAKAKDQSVPVGPDGVLLQGLELGEAADALPVLEVDALPEGGKLAGDALEKATVLGAAPAALRPLIEGAAIEGERGVEVTMRGGIPIRFGTAEDAKAKWAAAAAVLADPKTETLTYVDVRVPERPALGGAETPPPADPAVDPAAAAPVDPAVAPVEPAVAPEPVEPAL